MNPLGFAMSVADSHAYFGELGGAGACLDLLQRAAIFDRHDLDELGAVAIPGGEDELAAGAVGIAHVTRDEATHDLRIVLRQAVADIDEAMCLEVAAAMLARLERVVLVDDRLELDHGEIAAP